MEKQPIDLKNQVRHMEIGETIEQPIERLAVVRQYCYEIKLLEGKVYTTFVDKDKRVITITRVE